jgi:transcriptional regulator with XRE-family HTH domain
MTIPNNKIAEVRKRRKMSQQALADAVGAHSVTISNLERGKAKLTHEWLDKIAAALGVDWPALLDDEPATRVYVAGYIAKQGEVHWTTETTTVDAKLGFTSVYGAEWLLVGDDTLYPAFQAGDLLRMVVVDDEEPEILAACLGRLCLVQSTTNDNQFIGYLQRGTAANRFTFNRISATPITDVEIKLLCVIDRAMYRPALPEPLKNVPSDLAKMLNKD